MAARASANFGFAFLESPGDPLNEIDNDQDGVIDERQDNPRGDLVTGRDEIEAYVDSRYDRAAFENFFGSLDCAQPTRTESGGRETRTWTG